MADVDNREGDLFLFYKTNLSNRFRRALNLTDPVSSFNEQQNLYALTFRMAGRERLLTVSTGVMHSTALLSARTAKRMARYFPQRRVFFVCLASQKARLEQYVPPNWRFCVRPEDLAAALGVALTPEQDMQLRRFMPYDGPRDGPFRIHQQQQQQQQDGDDDDLEYVVTIGTVLRALRGRGVGDLEAALEASHQQYEAEQARNRVNVREQERKEHAWDRLFADPVPIREGGSAEGGTIACVACLENYASVRFVDAGGVCDHASLCDDCARIIMDTTKKCPLCRAIAVTIRPAPPFVEEEEEGRNPPLSKRTKV